MWTMIINYLFDKGGLFGIVAVAEGAIIWILYRRMIEKGDKLEKTLEMDKVQCVDCVKSHAADVAKLQSDHQKQIDDMENRHTVLVQGFYETAREDANRARAENNSILDRVIDSNDNVTDGLNAVNNTLSGIAGKLNGKG